ncbi:hypothetical protein CR513_20645, partial [Mucuna pruriens]
IVHHCSVCLHLAETKSDYLCRDHLGSVSAGSDSASAEERCLNLGALKTIKVIVVEQQGRNGREKIIVIHYGVTNRFAFVHKGQKVILKPLSPREVSKDQLKMKMKREKEPK